MASHDELSLLRERHPAWRLLRADNAPLIIGFLGRVFVDDNVRAISRADLVNQLEDELYALRERLGDGAYPKGASAYVNDWAGPDAAWLRLHYLEGSDEPYVDATPALERAVAWVAGLQERAFVGTESRLQTIVGLLRQIVQRSDDDPDRRLQILRAERERLDAEIARAESGQIDVLDPTGQRDRYQQFASTARELLSDFREVEMKFRALDRQMRETIAGWDGSKGELLDQLLGDRNAIADSDQGRSFQAFYDFLLSAERQDELGQLLDEVHHLESIVADDRVRRIDRDWLLAADRTQSTVRTLSDQLRRFLDDSVWLENRRVVELLRSIESSSLALREAQPSLTMDLDATRPEVALPFERPLYAPAAQAQIDSTIEGADELAETTALFAVDHVDQQRLVNHVRAVLRHRTQVSLGELVAEHPPEHGLAEVMAWFALDDDGIDVVFDDDSRELVSWTADDDIERRADVPTLLYVRHDTARSSAPSQTPPQEVSMTPTTESAAATVPADDVLDLSRVVVPLMRGVLYQADNAATWALLRRHHARVRDHMAVMGLKLLVDDAEGYAHLRQMDYDDVDIPRLVPRHRLSFPVSLLLALLRKRLAEFDATSSDPRLILTRDQIADLLRVHLPQSTNEVRLLGEIDTLLTKVVGLGFLRHVTGQERTYEVRRILKAYVDAQWLAEFDARLREYVTSLEPAAPDTAEGPETAQEPTDG